MKNSVKITIVVLGILLITNPSYRAAKEYAGTSNANVRRVVNCMIFSVYKISYKGAYIGVCGNFFEIEAYQSKKMFIP